MKDLSCSVNVEQYRRDTLKQFFHEVLELDENLAQQSSEAVVGVLSDDVLTKFAHFLDFVVQNTAEKSCANNCSSCSGNCSSCQVKGGNDE